MSGAGMRWRPSGRRAVRLAMAMGVGIAGLAGCHSVGPAAPGTSLAHDPRRIDQPDSASLPVASQATYPRLHGRVEFPNPQKRAIAATTGEIVGKATVTVMDTAFRTLAATTTDAAGAFSLDAGGAFLPTAGEYYFVEATKGLAAGAASGNAVRLRTILHWTGSAWQSCSTGSALQISPATTAVAILKATRSDVPFSATIGTVNGTAIASGNAAISGYAPALGGLVLDLLWRDLDPLASITVTADGSYAAAPDAAVLVRPAMAIGTFSNTMHLLDGSVQLRGCLPRPRSEDEAVFSFSNPSVGNVAGVVATDGTYIYTKGWGANGGWAKIGTGYGGTTQGTNYGTTTWTTGTYSAAYNGGYLYQPNDFSVTRLERYDVSSGAVTTLNLALPLIYRETGVSYSGSRVYLHTDGRYFYSGAYAINTREIGHTVRVLDPSNNFNVVRQIVMDGANTPFAGTSYYTDGMIYDGVYLYAFEWIGGAPQNGAARMRRYRLDDGQLEIEYQVNQSYPADDPLTGTYDWVNNKFWWGNYQSAVIRRTQGRLFPDSGTWTSAPLDAGAESPLFGKLTFDAVMSDVKMVRLQMRSAPTIAGLASATWLGPTGPGDFYTASGTAVNPAHEGHRYFQIQATLAPDVTGRANTTPRLYGVAVEVLR